MELHQQFLAEDLDRNGESMPFLAKVRDLRLKLDAGF